MSFRMLRALYKDTPSRFQVYSGIHQNSPTDVLHLGIKIDLSYGSYIIVHINGYWKNHFQITHITTLEAGQVFEIARF